MIDLPVRFPSQESVIAEEVARFRALTPEQRVRGIRDLIAAGALLMRISPKRDDLRAHTLEQEEAARRAIREFLARHAG
jgi:hypothetical protein